jgi:aspartate aminotransferase
MEIFRSSINSNTKGVLINSPNNPSGIVYADKTLSEMCRIIKEKEVEFGTEIYLVSDEPYRKIIFDNLEYTHIFKYHDRSIVATSHSKDLALPGERIGYIAVNPSCPDIEELVNGLVFCNRTLGFVNAPALIQHLITHLQDTTIDVRVYEKKRDYLYKELTNMGYSLIKPQGAFYMFPKSPIKDDVQFSEELKENKVLVVPGRGFGLPGYFRISYCMEDATIQGSLEGLEKTISKYQ